MKIQCHNCGGKGTWMKPEDLKRELLCIGYLMLAFDEEKRSLHDRICDTRVVYK